MKSNQWKTRGRIEEGLGADTRIVQLKWWENLWTLHILVNSPKTPVTWSLLWELSLSALSFFSQKEATIILTVKLSTGHSVSFILTLLSGKLCTQTIQNINAYCFTLAMSPFILLSKLLFVACLLKKVYQEGKPLEKKFFFQNRWGAQFPWKKCT